MSVNMEEASTTANAQDGQWPVFDGYSPLTPGSDEIRLLSVQYDHQSGRLRADFQHHQLRETPSYHALSYYWGPPPRPDKLRTIIVEGAPVSLRPTTYGFLRQLCRRFDKVLIWIDALCINQRDTAERNEQVQMMGDIFSAALGVYVWLGMGNPDIEFAFDYMTDQLTPPQQEVLHSETLSSCMAQLHALPFWKRAWCVPELILAKDITVFYGTRACSWSDIRDRGDVVSAYEEIEQWDAPRERGQGSQDLPHFPFSHRPAGEAGNGVMHSPVQVIAEARTYRQFGREESIRDLLVRFGDWQCTEVRDRVFALRSLSSDRSLIKVDYSCPILDVVFATVSAIRTQDLRDSTENDLGSHGLIEDDVAWLMRCMRVTYADIHADSIRSLPSDRLMVPTAMVNDVFEQAMQDATQEPAHFAIAYRYGIPFKLIPVDCRIRGEKLLRFSQSLATDPHQHYWKQYRDTYVQICSHTPRQASERHTSWFLHENDGCSSFVMAHVSRTELLWQLLRARYFDYYSLAYFTTTNYELHADIHVALRSVARHLSQVSSGDIREQLCYCTENALPSIRKMISFLE